MKNDSLCPSHQLGLAMQYDWKLHTFGCGHFLEYFIFRFYAGNVYKKQVTCANWGTTCSVWPLACTTLGMTGICTGKGMVCRTVCPPAVEMGIWTGMVAWGTPDCITCVAIWPTCAACVEAAWPPAALAVADGRTLPTVIGWWSKTSNLVIYFHIFLSKLWSPHHLQQNFFII